MMKDIIIAVLAFWISQRLCDLVIDPIIMKWKRHCNFKCDKCKVWDCDKKVCDFKKLKYLSTKDGVDNEED